MNLLSWSIVQYVLHQALFGAIAAAGFGVLFNFGARSLIWCAGMGALALAVRTVGQSAGWSLEAASFVAALSTSGVVFVVWPRLGAASNAIALAGCIPMVPGAFLSQALLGFLALSAPEVQNADVTIVLSVQAMLRVVFTLGAIGAGLAIPSHLARHDGF
jgi:uncharacterized membrane protein YjjB (DUF3815 family)